MTRVIERAQAGYEATEVEYGVVYRWCPASVLVECECGERARLTRTEAVCPGCGKEHAVVLREESEAGRLKEAVEQHPWRDCWEREEVVAGTAY